MGVTKALSMKKHYASDSQCDKIFVYSLKSMFPVLCSYIVATFIYSYKNLGGGINYNTILANILDFSASGPFYFIEYYIMLTLWAPLLYSAIKYLICKNIQKKYKVLLGIMLYIFIWGAGYWSIGRMNVFGQSYFFCVFSWIVCRADGIAQSEKNTFCAGSYYSDNWNCFDGQVLRGQSGRSI